MILLLVEKPPCHNRLADKNLAISSQIDFLLVANVYRIHLILPVIRSC